MNFKVRYPVEDIPSNRSSYVDNAGVDYNDGDNDDYDYVNVDYDIFFWRWKCFIPLTAALINV